MRKLLTVIAIMAFQTQLYAGTDVVYGKDNRQDVYQVSNALHLELAKSTAGMVHMSRFSTTAKKNVLSLKTISLERALNLCPSEAFSQQPLAPNCSGFLIAPDLLVTAGHCFKSFDTPENVCDTHAWVFDYHMTSEKHDPSKEIPLENVYLCHEVIAAELNNYIDYAIIRLDRKVTGRKPLKYRQSGKINDKSSLVVIGHPSGLPTKIADGGKVTKNSEKTRFSTTLDTFQGNSGSAVFNSKTGMLEGILIMGRTDYRLSKPNDPLSCKVVNKCDEHGNACDMGMEYGPINKGEVVLRIGMIKSALNKALEPK